MTTESDMAQTMFLSMGGCAQRALVAGMKAGYIQRSYEYKEYPRSLRISKGVQEIERTTETCRNQILKWTEKKEIFEDIVVANEQEEERILAGGLTSSQIEEQRQSLILRCQSKGITVDRAWSTVRLRRELGDVMGADVDDMGNVNGEMAQLTEKLARLQAVKDARVRIAELEAELAQPQDDAVSLRIELQALGVKTDGRWSTQRLREELDRATSPQAA